MEIGGHLRSYGSNLSACNTGSSRTGRNRWLSVAAEIVTVISYLKWNERWRNGSWKRLRIERLYQEQLCIRKKTEKYNMNYAWVVCLDFVVSTKTEPESFSNHEQSGKRIENSNQIIRSNRSIAMWSVLRAETFLNCSQLFREGQQHLGLQRNGYSADFKELG